jgi:hypothetical protein
MSAKQFTLEEKVKIVHEAEQNGVSRPVGL